MDIQLISHPLQSLMVGWHTNGAELAENRLDAAVLVSDPITWRQSSSGELGLQKVQVERRQHSNRTTSVASLLHHHLYYVLPSNIGLLAIAEVRIRSKFS